MNDAHNTDLVFQGRRLVMSGKALKQENKLFHFQSSTVRGISMSFILIKYFLPISNKYMLKYCA